MRKQEKNMDHDHPLSSSYGWDRRYTNDATIVAAGTRRHTHAGNLLFYRAKFEALDRCLKFLGVQLKGCSILDAAGGTGNFIPYYLRQGAERVVNADFSQAALDQAALKWAGDLRVNLRLLDLMETWDFDERFDFVFIMEAIFLLPSEKALYNAIKNVSGCLKPGGHAVISDIFPSESFKESDYVTHRPRAVFETMLADNRLQVLGYIPQTFIFNRRLFGPFQRIFEHTGSLIYWLDQLLLRVALCKRMDSSSTTKYLLAVKSVS